MQTDPIFWHPDYKQAAIDALVERQTSIRLRIDTYERAGLACEGIRKLERDNWEALRTISNLDLPIGRGSPVPYEIPRDQ